VQVHVAYQTSGCIAVHDHDAVRHLSFVELIAGMLGSDDGVFSDALATTKAFVAAKKPGQVLSSPLLFCIFRNRLALT
jgi:glucosamine-6-phosphate deaminase